MAEREGYCERHARHRRSEKEREYDRGRGSAARRGYGRRHRKLRKLVMAEQPVCAAAGCEAPGVELDHVDGDAGNTARGNLQMLCKAHHTEKTNREQGGGWRR